jgi:hypothetical protein
MLRFVNIAADTLLHRIGLRLSRLPAGIFMVEQVREFVMPGKQLHIDLNLLQ